MLWFKNDFDSTNYLKILFLMFFVIYRWHRGSTHRDSAGRIPGQSSLLYPWCLFVCLICIYLFSLWLCWVFVAAYGLSLAVASRATLYLGCSGFSLPWLLSLWSMRSRARRLQWLQHVGSLVEAQLPCSMWDLPRPGIEPLSLALQRGFLTTGPPGKPLLNPWCFNHSEVCFVFSFNKDTLTCDIS